LLVTVNNRLILEIEIVHKPIVSPYTILILCHKM